MDNPLLDIGDFEVVTPHREAPAFLFPWSRCRFCVRDHSCHSQFQERCRPDLAKHFVVPVLNTSHDFSPSTGPM